MISQGARLETVGRRSFSADASGEAQVSGANVAAFRLGVASAARLFETAVCGERRAVKVRFRPSFGAENFAEPVAIRRIAGLCGAAGHSNRGVKQPQRGGRKAELSPLMVCNRASS